jgi:UDP-N-acetylmuramoyl-L-alanyl-D-glutamate--2,6-diaminopimelate ligase
MMPVPHIPRAWLLSDLFSGLAAVPAGADVRVGQLTLDSRRIEPGGLFLACRGTAGHGLAFAEDAWRRGAVAIAAEPDEHWDLSTVAPRLGIPVIPVPDLARRASAIADRFFEKPSAALEIIGVTGTNGKTSVTHYLAQALAPEFPCGIVGTVGCGFPGALAAGAHTTPDPVSLQGTLASLRRQGAEAVAMEVSSHALDQGRAEAVRFAYAVFTNLSRDHLDYHLDMQSYAAAKARLFRSPGLRWAVLNLDDPLSPSILSELPPALAVAFYSLQPNPVPPGRCDLLLHTRQLTPLPRGLRLAIQTKAGSGELKVGVLGRFNAANLLAVLGVLLARGLPLARALDLLSAVRGVPGRMECFGGDGQPFVVVDYAHTPDALEKALTSLRAHTKGRLVTVFGCGGQRDRGKRPLMGEIAERLSDRVILTDDNPRHEDGDQIIAEILAGVRRPADLKIERQRGLAIRLAIATASERDMVLVAGKGHERVQDMGELKVHFSDRAQVVQALHERGGTAP